MKSMAKKRLLVTVLILALTAFFAVPLTVFAVPPGEGDQGSTGETGTAVHLKNNSGEGITSVVVYFGSSSLPLLLGTGNNWEASDSGTRVLDDITKIVVNFEDYGSIEYIYDDHFGPQGQSEEEPIEYSNEGTGSGSINLWLNSVLMPEPEEYTLTINKDVAEVEDSTPFTFNVYESVEGQKGDLVAENVTASELESGSVDLPAGWYIVEEEEKTGYTPEDNDIEVEVGDDLDNEVNFVNNIDSERVLLTINKDVAEAVDSTPFTFNIYESVEGQKGALVAEDVSSSELESGTVWLLPGWYIVEEEEKIGYTPEDNNIEVEVGVELPNEVDFVNVLSRTDPGTLTILKNVDNVTDSAILFEFDVYEGAEDSYEEEDLVVSVSASEVSSASISLPPGTYTVVETLDSQYMTADDTKEITIGSGQEATITFVNTLKQPSVSIEKKVKLDNTEGAAQESISVGTLTPNVEYHFVITNTGNVTIHSVHVSDSTLDWMNMEEAVTLEPGEWVEFVYDYEFTGNEWDDSETFVNAAVGMGHYGESEVTSEEDEAAVNYNDPETREPDILLDKSVSDSVVSSRGSDVEYTFSVTNNGDYNLYNVVIHDDDINEDILIGNLGVGQTTTASIEFDLSNVGDEGYGDWDGDLFVNTAEVTGNSEGGPVSDTNDATVRYRSSGGGGGGGGGTTTVDEEPTPAAPVEEIPVMEEPIPAAPLPQTGGTPALLLYSLGALLASSGAALKLGNRKR